MSKISKIKKHRTLLFSFSLVLIFSFIGYGYKKIIRPYIYMILNLKEL
jgi:hypothetical protein